MWPKNQERKSEEVVGERDNKEKDREKNGVEFKKKNHNSRNRYNQKKD